MVNLDLHESVAYPLFRHGNLVLRGYIDFQDSYYHNHKEYSDNFFDIFVLENLSQFKNLNGNFFVVSETETYVLAVVDRISSFPIYYYEKQGVFTISDRLPEDGKVDKRHLDEFLSCGFVLGNDTVYENVYQLQAGQALVYEKESGKYQIKNYFSHIHHPITNRTEEQWIRELGNAIGRTFDNMITRLNGRHVALFLSGGFDSKLIISELRKRNYENVTCIILGSESTKDVIVAKEIAKTLNYKYIHKLVNKQYWKEKRKEGYMDEYFKKCASFSSMPYLQGIVIKDLIDSKDIPEDSVIITGNSGDVVEGNDVTHCFYEGEKYDLKEVKKWIMHRHFSLNGIESAKQVSNEFDIERYVISEHLLDKKRKVTAEEAEDIIEFFNWRERQCKYVIHDVRNYDYIIGTVEWLLPLWDNEFVDFWLTVPYELRYNRKLYYMYLGAETLPSANNRSLLRKGIDQVKKLTGDLILPLYKIKAKYDYKHNDVFFFASYGLIEKEELAEILRKTKGYSAPHSENIARMTAKYF